jgi:DNA-directed RNA polymerase specialized sigma24 family protein
MLGLPAGTVKTYLFRARKMLAEDLARERVRKGGA